MSCDSHIRCCYRRCGLGKQNCVTRENWFAWYSEGQILDDLFHFNLSICKQSVHNLGTNSHISISQFRIFHLGICRLKVFVRTVAACLTWMKLSSWQTLHPLWFQLLLLQMSEIHHICVKNRCISVSQLHEYSIAGVICASAGYSASPHFFECVGKWIAFCF